MNWREGEDVLGENTSSLCSPVVVGTWMVVEMEEAEFAEEVG